MCDLSTIVVGLANGLKVYAGYQQAELQADVTRVINERNTQNLNKAYQDRLTAKRAEERQQAIITAQELEKASQKAIVAKSSAQVAAGEAGIKATSVNVLDVIQDFAVEEAKFSSLLAQQQNFRDTSSALNLDIAKSDYQQQWQQINKPIYEPDYLGTAADLFAGGADTYKTYQANRLYDKEFPS